MSKASADTSVASIEYEELEIEVGRCLCGKAEVRILRSRFDRPRERFRPSYKVRELHQRLEELDEVMVQGPAPRRKQLAESIGQELYNALLPGKVRQTFAKSLASLHMERTPRNVGLRLRLSFGEASEYLPGVVGLPWELLCSPEKKFLSSAPQTPLVRHLDPERPVSPVTITPPIRVLAVLAVPRGLPLIDRERHEEVLRSACGLNGRLKLALLRPPTLSDLRDELGRAQAAGKPIHVIHFLGHGGFDPDGEGQLNFERSDSSRDRVPGRVLAQSLSGFPEVRLVVLSSCLGARMMRRHGQHPFAGTASALVAEGLPAVVGMQFPVSEDAASAFTHSFYRSLADGRSLEEAVTEGRQRILTRDATSFEWASPVLFLRVRDGKVFDLAKTDSGNEPRRSSDSDHQPGQDSNKSSGVSTTAGRDAIHRDSIRAGRDVNIGSSPRRR